VGGDSETNRALGYFPFAFGAVIRTRNFPISLRMLWRSDPGGSLRAVSNSFAAIASSSCSLSARISPSPPAPALRVAVRSSWRALSVPACSFTEFVSRLSAALMNVHDLPAAIRPRSHSSSSNVQRILGITQSSFFSSSTAVTSDRRGAQLQAKWNDGRQALRLGHDASLE